MPRGTDRPPPAVAAALGGLLLLATLGLRHGVCDDGYITLSVVRNLLAGAGPHLDPAPLAAGHGDAVLSTLLWPAVLAAPALAGVPPLSALAIAGPVSLLLLAGCGYAAARALSGSAVSAAAAAALLMTHPLVLLPALGGMETALALALPAAGAWALARRRFGAVAAIAGLAPWVRFDGALLTLVLLAALVVVGRREPRAIAARSAVLGGAFGAGAFVAHRLLFGRWLPDSIAAKLATGSESWADGATAVALEFAKASAGMSAYWLVTPTVHLVLVPLALAGAVRLARRRVDPDAAAALAALALWAASYLALFVLSGRGYARNFPWYFAPPLVALAAFAAVGLGPVAVRIERAFGRGARLLPAAAVALAALAAAPSLVPAFERVGARFTSHRERAYAAAATWLGANGPATSVASNEIGALAWFSPPGTRIVDLFGISRTSGTPRRSALELVKERRPSAIVTRLDFRYRREIEAALPDAYVWVRFGSLDLGLEPALAARLEPHAAELERIYRELTVESGGR